MSTDRELLKLAARAAGYWIVGPVEKYIVQLGHYENGFVIRNDRGGDSCWNPLTDDGDALRLAVKLQLQITPGTYNKDEFTAFHAGRGESHEYRHFQQDEFASTRRAIVRAAAEIGKGKA